MRSNQRLLAPQSHEPNITACVEADQALVCSWFRLGFLLSLVLEQRWSGANHIADPFCTNSSHSSCAHGCCSDRTRSGLGEARSQERGGASCSLTRRCSLGGGGLPGRASGNGRGELRAGLFFLTNACINRVLQGCRWPAKGPHTQRCAPITPMGASPSTWAQGSERVAHMSDPWAWRAG